MKLVLLLIDTLDRTPVWGIISSLMVVGLSTIELLQIIGLGLGLIIALITAILRIMDLRDKFIDRKNRTIRKRKKLFIELPKKQEKREDDDYNFTDLN